MVSPTSKFCVLDKSRTGQLADATGNFACLVFVLLVASARPRVVQSASRLVYELSSLRVGCGLMMHRLIGAHSHRPLATVDVFELLHVICRKSPTIFQRVLSISGLLVVTDRCVVLYLMYSRDYFDDDTSRVGHRLRRAFSTDLILLTTFRRRRNLFFKVRLQIFRRRVPASCQCLQCPPISRCIINQHRAS